MKRHWSFVVCDPKYLYPFVVVLLSLGVLASVVWKDPVQLNRVGNFIIGTGVWMSMRYTLREGISKYRNTADSSPTVPDTNQLNTAFFNNVAFAIGDAQLQVHGFVLVIVGSLVGSYGDVILRHFLPASF